MKEDHLDEREFSSLARRLRGADLSADSRVKDALKARLLAARRPSRRVAIFAWLVPAVAAAALFVIFGPRPEPPRAAPAASSPLYSLPEDGYGPCGRRGLGDFMASERF